MQVKSLLNFVKAGPCVSKVYVNKMLSAEDRIACGPPLTTKVAYNNRVPHSSHWYIFQYLLCYWRDMQIDAIIQ